MRTTASISIHSLGADVLALVSTENLQADAELRRPVQEGWDSIMRVIAAELAGMREPEARSPSVPDELIANSLNEALQGTMTRALWDIRFPMVDVLRAHIWLWLAIRRAMQDSEAINRELASYEERISQVAAAPAPIFPNLG